MTTEEKASAYAEKVVVAYDNDFMRPDVDTLKNECGQAYLAGAAEALRSQWKDASKEPPERHVYCITMADEDAPLCLCHFDGDVFIEDYSGMACAVRYYLEIPTLPPLPDTQEQ